MRAFTEYLRGAERGYAIAQFNLGVSYAEGELVARDYVLAYMWFSVAADQGEDEALEKCDEVANLMTPEQIAEAEKMAKEMAEKIAKNRQESR